MNFRKILLALTLMTFVAIAEKPADAAVVWSAVASNCTAAPSSVAQAADPFYGVTFASSTTGDIILYCNIDLAAAPNIASMSVTYRDSDGTGTTGVIYADIWVLDKSTGTGGTLFASGFVSNNYTDTGTTKHDVVYGPTSLDYVHKYYFVRIVLSRSSTSTTENIVGVALNY